MDVMKKYSKLVRDKIPEIIKASGKTPRFRVIEDNQEYLRALLDKDEEESRELRENPSLGELADKLEVIYAITKRLGYTRRQLEAARAEKARERGGFAGKIFLESTD